MITQDDIINLELSSLWNNLKYATYKRRQILLFSQIMYEDQSFQIDSEKNYIIGFPYKEQTQIINDLTKRIIDIYYNKNKAFDKNKINNYLKIIRHVIENKYIIKLSDFSGLYKGTDFLYKLYEIYESTDNDFPFTKIIKETYTKHVKYNHKLSHTTKTRIVNLMIENINNLDKKYMSDIISIDTDNMQEFYNIMKKRLKPPLNMDALIALIASKRKISTTQGLNKKKVNNQRSNKKNNGNPKTHKNESWQNAAARFSLKQNK
jgi:hypothetical protein